jgi:hypothetical protein
MPERFAPSKAILALVLVGCASHGGEPAAGPASGSTSPSASASEPASGSASPSGAASASASTSGSAPGKVPTGGVVSLGEVVAPKHFDPNPVLLSLKPQFLDCFNKARAGNPKLHGKLQLKVQVRETGDVNTVDADPGDSAYDPELLVCLGDVFKSAKFPPPGGTATILVPVIFRQ